MGISGILVFVNDQKASQQKLAASPIVTEPSENEAIDGSFFPNLTNVKFKKGKVIGKTKWDSKQFILVELHVSTRTRRDLRGIDLRFNLDALIQDAEVAEGPTALLGPAQDFSIQGPITLFGADGKAINIPYEPENKFQLSSAYSFKADLLSPNFPYTLHFLVPRRNFMKGNQLQHPTTIEITGTYCVVHPEGIVQYPVHIIAKQEPGSKVPGVSLHENR